MASAAQLRQIRAQKKSDYAVRTRFVDAAGEPSYINHLVAEDSPYLLQHAHNPVNWYPWGRAAFDKAVAEDKPVFLSIGYSTCHWCHVMEEESFDDEEVADFLNRHFVSIKVDREQRPDLDEYYMTGVQLVTGQGGWPMSNLLTPEGKPFFGGTYFPKQRFLALLEQARATWQDQPGRLRDDADNLDQGIRRQLAPAAAAELPDGLAAKVVAALTQYADSTHGGFGSAPKFPQEPNLALLAEYVARTGQPLAEQPAWTTLSQALDAMLAGGIYDQIGGGFHRYATDAAWQVPHFEKMLYNQGQLADVYLDAWLLSGEPAFRRIVAETLDYLSRDMQAPDGGFYSATDADSEGAEGRYFIWRYAELAAVLDADQLAFCETVFGVTEAGNFEGANILHLLQPLAAAAETLGLTPEAFDQRLHEVRQRLYEVREQRVKPLRDDKHIAEWNGMVIGALARAALALDRPDYRAAAERAADYLWHVHHDADQGMLWRTSLHGAVSVAGQLEDYAHLMDGLVALYDATAESDWLTRARTLLDEVKTRHWDAEAGGFFGPPPHSEGPQPLRGKSLMDNATVSGNSLMPAVLLALYERTGENELRELADAQIAAFAGHIARLPLAGPIFLKGVCRWHEPTPSPLQYCGDGAIRAYATSEAPGHIQVDLQIRAGWHIQPFGAGPEATRLARLNNGASRPQEQVSVSASDRTEEELTGAVTLTLDSEPTATPQLIELHLQACTDRACLPPETRRFILP